MRMPKLNNQNGFTAIDVTLVVALLLLIGGLGYFAYQARHVRANHTVSTPQITQTPQPTASTMENDMNTLPIKEEGIQMTLNSNFKDPLYEVQSGADHDTLGFSTRTLLAAASNCRAVGGTLGWVYVYSHPASNPGGGDNQDGQFMAQAGTKYIYYRSPQSDCAFQTPWESRITTQIQGLQQALRTARPLP